MGRESRERAVAAATANAASPPPAPTASREEEDAAWLTSKGKASKNRCGMGYVGPMEPVASGKEECPRRVSAKITTGLESTKLERTGRQTV